MSDQVVAALDSQDPSNSNSATFGRRTSAQEREAANEEEDDDDGIRHVWNDFECFSLY